MVSDNKDVSFCTSFYPKAKNLYMAISGSGDGFKFMSIFVISVVTVTGFVSLFPNALNCKTVNMLQEPQNDRHQLIREYEVPG